MGSLIYKDKPIDYAHHDDISSINGMKEIGLAVKNLLTGDPYLQIFFVPRWTTKTQNKVEVDGTKKNIPWNVTLSSQKISAEDSQRAQLHSHLYNLCKQFSLQNGESCQLYKCIIFDDFIQGKKLIGQVIEILQVTGSLEAQEHQPNFILVSILSATSISEVYGMPLLTETNSTLLVSYKVSSIHYPFTSSDFSICRVFCAWQIYSTTVLPVDVTLEKYEKFGRSTLRPICLHLVWSIRISKTLF